jgi:glycosyltransferase involved in cell wall biosynthesis
VLRDRPHVIHAHLHEGGLLGWALSRLTGAPLVFDFQGSMTGEMIDHHFLSGRDSRVYRPLRWLEQQIDHAAPVVLTSSQHAASLLENEFGVPRRRIHPLPDCVNADAFSPEATSPQDKAALRRALGIPRARPLFVYLGLLTEYQGIGLLLEAARQLKDGCADFHLLVMGFPHAGYQARAADMGLTDRITFTGKVAYEDAPRYLALGDFAVAPKVSATEGSGKILNYMSMALPTLAFDLPVSREYLGDTGIYAGDISSHGLAAGMAALLVMPAESRREIGERLRERARSLYSWDRAGVQLEDIYRQLRRRCGGPRQ